MYISHKQEGSMFSLLLHLWKYGIAKFLLFLLSVVEHPFWSLGMSFSFLSSGLFPRLSFPSVFFVLFFLSPFAFRLFSPYLCSAGGGARAPSPFPFPSLSSPVGAFRRFGSALAGFPSGPSGFPGAALLRLRRAPFAVPSRFLPLSARHGPLRRVILFRIFQCFALYAPSSPRSGPVPCRRPVPCGVHMARLPVSLPPSVLSVFAKTFPFRPKKVPRFFGRPPFLCYLCIRFRPQAGRVPAGASFFERIYIKDREKVVQESGIPLPARPMPCGAGVSV